MAKRKPSRPQTGANDIAQRMKQFLERIENIDAEKAEHNKQFAEEKKIVFEDAEREGVDPKTLRVVLGRRKAERKDREKVEKLDIDQKAQLNAAEEARLDRETADRFGDTPMGGHLAERANALSNGEGDAPRPDEEHLANIGRGPEPLSKGDVLDELTER